MKLLARISKIIPEGAFKNKIRCLYYNVFFRKQIKMKYKKGMFITEYQGYTIKTRDHIFRELIYIVPYYLKRYKLKKGDVVIDAGAYIGGFALLAAMMVGEKGEVIAFEPNPYILKKLQENIELNNIKNITAVGKGLWDKEDVLKFHQDISPSASSSASSFILDDNPYITNKDENIIKLSVWDLDSALDWIMPQLGLNKVDFIKMDIEGSEIKAVEGMKKTLKKYNVNLAIASYHHFEGKQTSETLEKQFKELGYMAQTKESIHTTTYARKETIVGK